MAIMAVTVQILFLTCLSVAFRFGHPQTSINGAQCSWLVQVDEVFGSDCSGLSLEEQQNYTCNSLQDALSLVSSSFSPESCVEVIINQGRYIVEGTVIVTRDLVIHGRDDHVVTVELLIQPSSDFQYSLSFRNTSSAVLRNIEFLGSNGVITFDNVSRVEVSDSSFRYFSQGAVDIFNSFEVSVYNCLFENNGPVVISKFVPFRGHSAGLSIAFNSARFKPTNRTQLTAVVRDSVFRNNTVLESVSIRRTTTQLLRRFLATGRGGGYVQSVHSSIAVEATVTGCVFERNFATSYGGGVFMAWTLVSNHTTTISHTSFVDNKCLGGAGGIEIGFGRTGPENQANRLYASDLHFVGNSATFGGGAYVFLASNAIQDDTIGNFVSFRNCIFERNAALEYGGAVGFILPSFNIIFHNRDSIIPMEFNNCSFLLNDGGQGGVVSTSYVPVAFGGNNTFLENRGTSLTILGTMVHLEGQLNFINNDASGSNGGAVYAISLGQLQLKNGSKLLFKNNSGNLGASLVVNTIYVPRRFTQLMHNPLCVLLLENKSQSFSSIDPEDISVTFSGNKAVVGAAVYTNEIGLCSWTGGNRPYFNHSLAFRWDFINYSESNRDSAHSPDDTNPLYYVQTEEGQLQLAVPHITAYPGESVSFKVKVKDDLSLPTVGVFRFSHLTDLDVEFTPSVVSLSNVQDSVNTSVLINRAKETTRPVEAIVESLLQKNTDIEKFILNLTSCPLGYVLLNSTSNPNKYKCQCGLEQNKGIVNCEGLDIKIKDGYWASAATLQTIPCPRLYCRCHMFGGNQRCSHVLREGDQDSQCACDREGVLCGSCKDGRGVSVLLNRCVSCSNASILLLVALTEESLRSKCVKLTLNYPLKNFFLVAADCLVYVILILLSMQIPSWLFPCLLYVQILPFIGVNFPSTFGNAYNALYYITSVSSFYLAYDFCLLSNLSPLLSYLFRYIPLIVALILCPTALSLGRYFRHYRRRKGLKLKKWRGVWWIVNLMYSYNVHTSLNILKCNFVDISTTASSLRWYISGDVECYRGFHLPLALFAIVVLVAALLAIPFTGIITAKKVEFINHFIEPLLAPFRSQCRWWFAVELGKRFTLILFIVVFPTNNFPTLLVISVFIASTGLAWPYRDTWTTVLELVISADVMFLLLFRNTKQFVDVFSSVSLEQANSTDQCVEHSFQPSKLSYILLPFYYLPLLLSAIAFCVWIISSIRKAICIEDTDLVDLDLVLSSSVELARAQTSTQFSLKELLSEGDEFQHHYNRIST